MQQFCHADGSSSSVRHVIEQLALLTFQCRPLHLSLCIWFTHLKFRWGSWKLLIPHLCAIWKTKKFGDLIWPAQKRECLLHERLIKSHSNCKVAVKDYKNMHDVIRYSKQMHVDDSCCCCACWWWRLLMRKYSSCGAILRLLWERFELKSASARMIRHLAVDCQIFL